MQKGMSALLPIATAKANFRKGSCPLYPRKRTCAAQTVMSALGQKRTSTYSNKVRLSLIPIRRTTPALICFRLQVDALKN